jgi:hypothetical protein
MRQPPNMVPSAIAAWQIRITQIGISESAGRRWVAISRPTMMPMVFWASLPPWPRL